MTNPWWGTSTGEQVQVPKSRRIVLTCVALFAGTFIAAAALPDHAVPNTGATPDGGRLTYQTISALLGQCGPTYTYQIERPAHTDVVDGPIVGDVWDNIVPIRGPMVDAFVNDQTFYPPNAPDVPPFGKLVRAQWEGKLVVHYSPNARDVELKTLRTMSFRDDLNMIVVPWQGMEPLPAERTFAWATWGSTQSCHTLTPLSLEQFRAAHPPQQAPGFKPPTINQP